MRARRIYLSLGSNLGDRLAMLQAAIDRLHCRELKILKVSPVYESAPLDYTLQPWFLNAVVEAETLWFPLQLLGRLQRVELQLGRRRYVEKGPRRIDIDILLYEDCIIRTPQLTVPHPRLTERRFALEPLLELNPDLIHPELNIPLARLLPKVASQRLRKTDLTLRVPPPSE